MIGVRPLESSNESFEAYYESVAEWGLIDKKKFAPDGGKAVDIPPEQIPKCRDYIRGIFDKFQISMGQGFNRVIIVLLALSAVEVLVLLLAHDLLAQIVAASFAVLSMAGAIIIGSIGNGKGNDMFISKADIHYYEFTVDEIIFIKVMMTRPKKRRDYRRTQIYAKFGYNYALIGYNDYNKDKYEKGGAIGCWILDNGEQTFLMLTRPYDFAEKGETGDV